MAHVHKLGDKWRAEVSKAGQRATKVCATKREAQAWAIRKEHELSTAHGPRNTLQQAVDRYLATVSPTKRQPEWERRRFDALLAALGADTRLAEITSDTIARWRDARLKSVSGSTVQRESNLYRNMFTVAADEWRWIEHNPFKGVRLPKENQPRHQVWRWQQIKRVLRAREGAGPKTQEVIDAFRIALATGMRLAEALAAPAGFDARRRVVVLARTKTGGRVEIPIPRRALRLLARPAFVVGSNEASALFCRLCRQLEIDDLHFHDARASALTWLARRVDVLVLARISRHRDIGLLSRVYYRATAAEIAAGL